MRAATRLAAWIVLLAAAAAGASEDPVLWPEPQRAFFQDGPALLLGRSEREAFAAMGEAERDAFMARFLADPVPETAENELVAGIERRQELARSEILTPFDDRARLLFLQGAPGERHRVECGQTFVPLEIWRYAGLSRPLVLYEPAPRQGWRLWLPLDSKRALYNREMANWVEDWEALRGGRPPRFDLRLCPDARAVEQATGIEALTGFRALRPDNGDLLATLAPPADLAAWSRAAAATPLPEAPPELAVAGLEVLFTAGLRQRLAARLLLALPPDAPLGVRPAEEAPEGCERREIALALDGVVEQDGAVFDSFRVRFRRDPPPPGMRVALIAERLLRPQRDYLVRLRLRDEITGAETLLARGFTVPAGAGEAPEPPVPEDAVVALAEEVASTPLPGADALMLVPPSEEFLSGPWRAEALVTGSRIVEVVFLVDGEAQLTRSAPPYSAEVRLATLPRLQVVRAEGYDAAGELVASDQVTVNQPHGAFAVRIVAPEAGSAARGRVQAEAEIVVPDGRRIERVDFLVNDQPAARLTAPPWRAEFEVPETGGETPAVLAVVAELDDGALAEDVRFLGAPRFGAGIEVRLVELYAAVVDGSGAPVTDLGPSDFEVLQDGVPQVLRRCERVDDLPLQVGIVVDTSTSMASALPEAQRAATAFLEAVIQPKDRVFVLTFAGEPRLALAPTDDVEAAEAALGRLQSLGWTSLHDAVAASLHMMRAARGRRAVILLSDGDDTSSAAAFRDVLELARRSGVVVYPIGLAVSTFDVAVRRKLSALAEATGGRAFFVGGASELHGAYAQIERDLRSQYLLAFSPDPPPADESSPEIEVRVRGGRLKARTTRSYDAG